MKSTTTDGKFDYFIDECTYCTLNTSGEHESPCPLAKTCNPIKARIMKIGYVAYGLNPNKEEDNNG